MNYFAEMQNETTRLNESRSEELEVTEAMQVNQRFLFNVIAYSVMFIFGTIGNTIVSVTAYKQHRSPENNGRTNVHMMVLHLTIADLVVSYVVIPLEIGWRISMQWYAGNAACKLLMFVRAFAFYLSSMTLVCLSLDRYLAIAQPLASLKKRAGCVDIAKRRGRGMIVGAWIVSALFALPQTLVFRVLEHPSKEGFFQCTSMNFFDEVIVNGTDSMLTPVIAERIYNSIFLVAVYMVPLLVIVITYANILHKLFKKTRLDKNVARNSMDSEQEQMKPLMRWRSPLKAKSSMIVSSLSGSAKTELTCHESSQVTSSEGLMPPSAPGLWRKPFRKPRRSSSNQLSAPPPQVPRMSDVRRNRPSRYLRKQSANVVALRMSAIHVLAFLACWTPYLVISLWHIIDEASAEKVNPTVQDALFLTAVFNSCINPVVYGGFYFRSFTKRTMRRRSQTSKSFHASPRYFDNSDQFIPKCSTNRIQESSVALKQDRCLDELISISKAATPASTRALMALTPRRKKFNPDRTRLKHSQSQKGL